MFKVYEDNKLIGTFEQDIDAAIFATNKTVKVPLGVQIEVWGPKTNFIHFNIGYNIDGDDYQGIN